MNYAAFKTDGHDIGLDPNANASNPIPYWAVDDVHAVFRHLLAHGALAHEEPHTVGNGAVVAVVALPDVSGAGASHLGLIRRSG